MTDSKKRPTRKTTIAVDCEIDLKFKKIAASKFNFAHGWYTKAVNEALKEWVENNEKYFKLD
ncbi:MAG: hypothetical protein MJ224_01135 [archaeon]|nr:hypothetical protein [archaeon]